MGQESFRKASAHRTAFLSASILSIVLVIAAIGFGATWIAYDGPDDQRPVNPASIAASPEPVTPDCGQISLSREEYGTDLDQRRGEPGETVKLSGTTRRGEDGRWAASDRLEAWWNTDVPNGAPLIEGPVIRLLTVTNMETCRFEATFEVPDVEPGRYKISVFAWSANPDNGYGFALPHYFNVTTDPSALPPCDDDKGYGRTVPGRWLEELLVDIGAPGGHPVTGEQVINTETALQVDIPAYRRGPTIYTTMLAAPFPQNKDWEAPEREIGRHGDFDLFITEGDFAWESYTARSARWQLALIAYPGPPGQDQVRWPDETVDWLGRAIDAAQQSPPRCLGTLK
jgi:hypothetical protein